MLLRESLHRISLYVSVCATHDTLSSIITNVSCAAEDYGIPYLVAIRQGFTEPLFSDALRAYISQI